MRRRACARLRARLRACGCGSAAPVVGERRRAARRGVQPVSGVFVCVCLFVCVWGGEGLQSWSDAESKGTAVPLCIGPVSESGAYPSPSLGRIRLGVWACPSHPADGVAVSAEAAETCFIQVRLSESASGLDPADGSGRGVPYPRCRRGSR